MLRPVWAYGIQTWDCTKPSQTQSTQTFQSITLRLLTSALWYVFNQSLHKDLNIATINQVAHVRYTKFETRKFVKK